ncbi:MAG: hypothetical protein JWO66_1950 [Candidatus Eremiobacteraeota bacterium]|nr:hypothetical protein [Candidatus Eremiobacteraeota bacterium]
MARPLSALEAAILKRFESVNIPGATALAEQLRSAVVSDESKGCLRFVADDSTPPVASDTGLPLDGWYADDDGGLVMLILHVGFPEGRISALERFRPDGESIVNYEPQPEDVSVAPRALSGPGQGAAFDRTEGWRRRV